MLTHHGVYMVGNDVDFNVRSPVPDVEPRIDVWHVIRDDGQLIHTYYSERLAIMHAKALAEQDDKEFEKIMLEPTE